MKRHICRATELRVFTLAGFFSGAVLAALRFIGGI